MILTYIPSLKIGSEKVAIGDGMIDMETPQAKTNDIETSQRKKIFMQIVKCLKERVERYQRDSQSHQSKSN